MAKAIEVLLWGLSKASRLQKPGQEKIKLTFEQVAIGKKYTFSVQSRAVQSSSNTPNLDIHKCYELRMFIAK